MWSTWLTWCLAVFLLASGWTGAEHATSAADSTAPDLRGPVYVDATEILLLESFPVQVRLVVRGALPTPCHEAVWEVDHRDEAIEVGLWSEIDLGQTCAQVLEPFEITIPLGSHRASDALVVLNGEAIGQLAIGGEPDGRLRSLMGAGWSFGMCGGYCRADLAVGPHELVLTGGSHMTVEPVFVNRGALTAVGRKQLEAAVEASDSVALRPVYGCPDCADGGAAYLTLTQDGQTSRHEMELADPPPELADLHGLAMQMISSLETCNSGELVIVDDECTPPPAR
jgi:hypothetical protein